MFSLKLNAKLCISCGICMDVCLQRAIDMRIDKSRNIEGELLSFLALHPDGDNKLPPAGMMTFPWLANPLLCNGCLLCEKECPVSALSLQQVADNVPFHNLNNYEPEPVVAYDSVGKTPCI